MTDNERPLFGGALSCRLPTTAADIEWRDISEVRQVPDHQECWQDTQQRVMVVEILERQSSISDAAAAAYFFQDLAQANGAAPNDTSFTPLPRATTSLVVAGLPETARLCFGMGSQENVKRGNDKDIAGNSRAHLQEVQSIRVELCAIRLPSVETDLLITLSTPSTDIATDTTEFSTTFQQIVSSFQIKDWSLFG